MTTTMTELFYNATLLLVHSGMFLGLSMTHRWRFHLLNLRQRSMVAKLKKCNESLCYCFFTLKPCAAGFTSSSSWGLATTFRQQTCLVLCASKRHSFSSGNNARMVCRPDKYSLNLSIISSFHHPSLQVHDASQFQVRCFLKNKAFLFSVTAKMKLGAFRFRSC